MYHNVVLITVECHVCVLLNFLLCMYAGQVFTMMCTYIFLYTVSQKWIPTFVAVTYTCII